MKKLVLATTNWGKIREIKEFCREYEVIPYTELIDAFEIVEDAESFQKNALIKARAVYEALGDEDAVVVADDSGISVAILDGAPGIYSARYAADDANDKENLEKLIQEMKKKGVKSSAAYYTAAIAIVTKGIEKTVHGWMYGTALTQAKGEGGFGYDPIFVPLGYDKTLGELDERVKKELSHRAKAFKLASKILKTL
ncbi:MAG TPA: RdgB/HAM1 family non-canonical purine NTP pyrophosphatase [Campylobacterales bacterium]|nr:RdgB/HAM1 family non-canonical purine NTP pyrophosphatase [Campylobacterales bacterium]